MVNYCKIFPKTGNETRRSIHTNSIQHCARGPSQCNKARKK